MHVVHKHTCRQSIHTHDNKINQVDSDIDPSPSVPALILSALHARAGVGQPRTSQCGCRSAPSPPSLQLWHTHLGVLSQPTESFVAMCLSVQSLHSKDTRASLGFLLPVSLSSPLLFNPSVSFYLKCVSWKAYGWIFYLCFYSCNVEWHRMAHALKIPGLVKPLISPSSGLRCNGVSAHSRALCRCTKHPALKSLTFS